MSNAIEPEQGVPREIRSFQQPSPDIVRRGICFVLYAKCVKCKHNFAAPFEACVVCENFLNWCMDCIGKASHRCDICARVECTTCKVTRPKCLGEFEKITDICFVCKSTVRFLVHEEVVPPTISIEGVVSLVMDYLVNISQLSHIQ